MQPEGCSTVKRSYDREDFDECPVLATIRIKCVMLEGLLLLLPL